MFLRYWKVGLGGDKRKFDLGMRGGLELDERLMSRFGAYFERVLLVAGECLFKCVIPKNSIFKNNR